MTDTSERRRYRRLELHKPCKVFDPRSRKYTVGTTRDVSSHGMLLDLEQPLGLHPGDPVNVGVAVDDRHVILEAKEMAEGRVVRSVHDDGHTVLAIKFADSGFEETELPLRAAA